MHGVLRFDFIPSDLIAFSFSVLRFTSARRKILCMTSGASRIWNERGGNVIFRRNWLGLSSGELPPLHRQLSNRVRAVDTVLRVNEISWWLKPGGVCPILSPIREASRWTPKLVARRLSISTCSFGLARRDPETMNNVCNLKPFALISEILTAPFPGALGGRTESGGLRLLSDDGWRITGTLPLSKAQARYQAAGSDYQ